MTSRLALLVKPSLLTAAILLAQVLGAQPALAATQSGYQLWTDCAFVNFTCVSVQWEVFLGLTYSYVGGQIQIAPTEATVRSCLKNAQQIYWQFGYASSLFAQWYINNGSGDIDSDALNGSRNGFWPACSGSNDWMSLWTNGSYHWPPIGTRLRVPTSYCLDNGSGSAGCTTWRSTYTGWMN